MAVKKYLKAEAINSLFHSTVPFDSFGNFASIVSHLGIAWLPSLDPKRSFSIERVKSIEIDI